MGHVIQLVWPAWSWYLPLLQRVQSLVATSKNLSAAQFGVGAGVGGAGVGLGVGAGVGVGVGGAGVGGAGVGGAGVGLGVITGVGAGVGGQSTADDTPQLFWLCAGACAQHKL